MSLSLRQIGREPLVHFLATGALIFVVAHLWQREQHSAAQRIVIDAQLERRIAELDAAQNGATPTPAQLKVLVQSYVNDEMLYREALRIGLDRDDEIIRRRLIQKMQFLERDLASVSSPTERELHTYYDSRPALFLTPAAVSFEQIFFSADRDGSSGARARAQRTRAAITDTNSVPATGVSDVFPLSIPEQEITRTEANGLFGATAIIDTLFTAPQGRWSDPVRSEYGWHLVKVIHRHPSERLPFEAVRDQLRESYLNDQSRVAEERVLAALRARFEIVRQGRQEPWTS